MGFWEPWPDSMNAMLPAGSLRGAGAPVDSAMAPPPFRAPASAAAAR